jgi:tetratricopeptide (TPR) repeat protein
MLALERGAPLRRRCLLLLLASLCLPPARAAESPTQAAAFERGSKSYAKGDYASVVAELEPFARSGDAVPPTRTLLAAAYLELGRAADAAAVLRPAADSDAAGAPLLFQASRAAAALGDQVKADAYLARAAAKEPRSAAARALGMQYGATGRLAEACRLLLPYVGAHPEDGEARLAAAYCSLEIGQADGVADLLKDLSADEPRVRLLQARVAAAKGRPADAIAQLEPLAASPPPAVAHELRRVLSESYLAVGKAQAVVGLLASHVAGDPTLSYLLARAQQQAGDPGAAVATLAPFAGRLTSQPPPADLPASLLAGMALEWGRALLALQRWPDAVTALQAATRLDPGGAAGWQALVQALRGAGRREEAEAAIARLRSLAAPRPGG